MFKKLLANLPFNPGLLDQVAFYSKRMRHESSVRRLGFGLIGIGFFVQIVAAVYPAQNSLAASSNDVLNGITNKSSVLSAWDNNTRNIRAIYGKFGITRANIANISGQKPNATVVSKSSNRYWSVGRHPLESYGIDGSKWGERSVDVGNDTVYERPLHAWDTYSYSQYAAFHGKNKYGVDFWILQTCGNPTFVGPYLPQPPSPKLVVHKTLRGDSSVVHPGDTVKFLLEYQNTVKNSLATDFQLTDTLNSNFEFVSLGYLSSRSGNKLMIDHGGNLGYTPTPHRTTLVVKVKGNVANGTTICNNARATSDQGSDNSERACVTVVVPSSPSPPQAPSGYCIASSRKEGQSNGDFVVRTSAYVSNARITGYDYYLDGSSSIYAHDQTSETPHNKRITGLRSGSHEVRVYVNIAGANNQTIRTSVCSAQININEDPRVNLSKSVRNITKGVEDADSTKASGGDVLQFRLTTQNVTGSDYLNYEGQDYFGNVLQYADLIDPEQLTSQGVRLDSRNYLHWNTPIIKANGSDIKLINVRVKQNIPTTNSPSTLSPDYNCSINNTYGDQVTIAVDCSMIKTVSQVASQLPNTGAGSSVAIGAIVASMAGYLFMRSRIMAEELELVRQDYVSVGGL